MIKRHPSPRASCAWTGRHAVIPALLTRMSTLPKSATTAFAPALMDSSARASSVKALAVPPAAVISAATSVTRRRCVPPMRRGLRAGQASAAAGAPDALRSSCNPVRGCDRRSCSMNLQMLCLRIIRRGYGLLAQRTDCIPTSDLISGRTACTSRQGDLRRPSQASTDVSWFTMPD